MKLKIYKMFFATLIVMAIIVAILIGIKYAKEYKNEEKNQETVQVFSSQVNVQKENITMNGYKVIGIVKIPKIEIEYPILDIDTYNPEETKEPMKVSIVKYWGNNVNDYGNLSIAGHNNYSGTMFGKTKYLAKEDIVELTDLTGREIKYKIYDIFVTDPNDVAILKTTNENVREVTLITCTEGNKKRLILKAQEII